MLLSVLIWFAGIPVYGYFWADHILKTETLYGYERSRLLISSAFLVYKVPYLMIGLLVVVILELFLIWVPGRKPLS